jgi:hypothetical protein
VANLTQEQAEILVRIVQSGEDTVVFSEGHGFATLIAGRLNLEVKPADLRELVAQGLIRFASGQVYDLTNAGRSAYVQLTSPPEPERPPTGFRPPT